MKKVIFFIIMTLIVANVASQVVVTNKAVLYELDLADIGLRNQLDSIVFVRHPCSSASEKPKQHYIYFMYVEEQEKRCYVIDIIHVKPSTIESDFNTGIYVMNDKLFIVREESETPLFKPTKNKRTFVYEKDLMPNGDNSYYYIEIIYPEEVCIWGLYYKEDKLNVIELEQVKDAKKYALPPINQKLEFPTSLQRI